MRKTVEPPPSSRCDRCGGQLKLKRVDAAHAALGLSSTIYVCGSCGSERAFVSHQDNYARRFDSGERFGPL
jgi:uncharacterized protein with PIN domain